LNLEIHRFLLELLADTDGTDTVLVSGSVYQILLLQGLSGTVTHTQASETTSLSINGSSRATLGIYSAHEFANEEYFVSITQMVKRAPVNPDTLAGYLIDDGVEIVRRGGIKQRFADFNAT